MCKERFAAFHPAYESPEEVAAALEVLRRGKTGLAVCSTEVSSWDELPSFASDETGLAPRHTGVCKCCQVDMDAQAAAQAALREEALESRTFVQAADCFAFRRARDGTWLGAGAQSGGVGR